MAGIFAVSEVRPTYVVEYRAVDPSGLGEVVLEKKRATKRLRGDEIGTTAFATADIRVNGIETVLIDGALGGKIRLNVSDVHGNSGLYERRDSNTFAVLAGLAEGVVPPLPGEEIGFLSVVEPENRLIVALALLSGISYGGAFAIGDIVSLLKNLDRIVPDPEALASLIAVLLQGELSGLADAFIAPVQAAQQAQNPFSKLGETEFGIRDDDDYGSFATGWYLGALIGIIGAELLIGVATSGVGTVASGATTFFSSVSPKFARAARTVGSIRSTLRGPIGVPDATTSTVSRRLSDSAGLDATTVARELDGLSSARQLSVSRVLRSSSLDGVRGSVPTGRLVSFVSNTGDEGAALIADGGDGLIEATVSKGLIDRSTITRIRRLQRMGSFEQADIDRLGRLLNNGEMDEIDTQTLLSTLETRGASPLFGDDLTASDLLDLGERSDLLKTIAIVKNTDRNGDTQTFRLQTGDADRGFEKVLRKHVRGDLTVRETEGFNTFFPTGRTITINRKSQDLPNSMNEYDVKILITRALSDGQPSAGSGQRTEFEYDLREDTEDEFGIDRIKLIVNENGDVVTAFPDGNGENAYAWVGGRGESGAWGVRNDDGGLVFNRITVGTRVLTGGMSHG